MLREIVCACVRAYVCENAEWWASTRTAGAASGGSRVGGRAKGRKRGRVKREAGIWYMGIGQKVLPFWRKKG